MSNPRRARNIALAVFASGVALALFHFARPAVADEVTLLGILLVLYCPNAILFGGVYAASQHFATRTQRSLFRGEDVLARWHVDGSAWRKFVALNGRLNEAPGALPDEAGDVPDQGIAGISVIAGKSAVQIGEQFHSLPVRGTPEITQAALLAPDDAPPYIELALYYPGGLVGDGDTYPPRRTMLRVPVAQDAWRDARRVTAHYNRDLPGTPDFFHGRGDGSDPEDLSRCIACGYETHKFLSHCPRCGHGVQSRRWSRRFGGALVVCGVFLTVMMGVVLWNMVPQLLRPGVTIQGSRFTGTPFQALVILLLLGMVTLFGAGSFAYGLWQMRTGARHRVILKGIVAFAIVLFFAALLVGAVLD